MSRYTRILMFTAAIGCPLVCGLAAEPQDDAGPKVTKITTETPGIGDLSHALNIKKLVGTYHLSEKVTKVRLKLFFYQDGELVKSRPIDSLGLEDYRGADSGEFALQIVDPDYLSIRDAKPNSHRLHIEFKLGMYGTGTKIDISKSTFDVTGSINVNRFLPKYGKPNEAPLFAIIGVTGSTVRIRNAPDAVVEANPEADILIAVLEFK